MNRRVLATVFLLFIALFTIGGREMEKQDGWDGSTPVDLIAFEEGWWWEAYMMVMKRCPDTSWAYIQAASQFADDSIREMRKRTKRRTEP